MASSRSLFVMVYAFTVVVTPGLKPEPGSSLLSDEKASPGIGIGSDTILLDTLAHAIDMQMARHTTKSTMLEDVLAPLAAKIEDLKKTLDGGMDGLQKAVEYKAKRKAHLRRKRAMRHPADKAVKTATEDQAEKIDAPTEDENEVALTKKDLREHREQAKEEALQHQMETWAHDLDALKKEREQLEHDIKIQEDVLQPEAAELVLLETEVVDAKERDALANEIKLVKDQFNSDSLMLKDLKSKLVPKIVKEHELQHKVEMGIEGAEAELELRSLRKQKIRARRARERSKEQATQEKEGSAKNHAEEAEKSEPETVDEPVEFPLSHKQVKEQKRQARRDVLQHQLDKCQHELESLEGDRNKLQSDMDRVKSDVDELTAVKVKVEKLRKRSRKSRKQ